MVKRGEDKEICINRKEKTKMLHKVEKQTTKGLSFSAKKLHHFSWLHFPITFFSYIHQIATVTFPWKMTENAI